MIQSPAELPHALTTGRIIAILRNFTPIEALHSMEDLASVGVSCVEVTMGSPDATNVIAEAVRSFPGLAVGAGTIRSIEELARAADAGATFMLSPHVDSQLIMASVERRIPFIAGGFTATECVLGMAAGASAIKLFPAATGGPEYVAALRQPLPDIPLIPTGGVTVTNARAFFEAGALAVALGNSLVSLKREDLLRVAEELLIIGREAG